MRKWIGLLLSTTILLNLVTVAPAVYADTSDRSYDSDFLREVREDTNFYSNPGFELTNDELIEYLKYLKIQKE